MFRGSRGPLCLVGAVCPVGYMGSVSPVGCVGSVGSLRELQAATSRRDGVPVTGSAGHRGCEGAGATGFITSRAGFPE